MKNKAESNLLSICLSYPDLLPNVRAIVQPEMFANKRFGIIYDTALGLYDKDVAVDSVTVSAKIMDDKSLLSKFGKEIIVNECLDEIRIVSILRNGSAFNAAILSLNSFFS